MYARRKNCFLFAAVLAAVLCATLFLPSRALALDYLDGALTEKQAATEVGIYCAWTSSTGRKLNGYDSSQSMYSDTNLSKIHEWNQDFKAFNAENGDAINTVWPVSAVTDIAYVPTHTQYDDLYRDVSTSYEQFRQRYPNASLSDWQLNFGAINNPTRCLMQGFALSNSTKEYGTTDETAEFYSRVAFGVAPAHTFTYNGQQYQIGPDETYFSMLQALMSGESVRIADGTWRASIKNYFLNGYPMYYIAYPVGSTSGFTYSAVIAYDFQIVSGNTQLTLTGFNYANGTVSPSRAYCSRIKFEMNNELHCLAYTSGQGNASNFWRYGESNAIFVPISVGSSFPSGGGENNPNTNGGNTSTYINVPSPTITYNGGDVSYNSTDNSVTIGSVTYEQGQYEYDQSSDTYTVYNNQTYNYYTVTNDTPESPVKDTNDGLGWLGTLLNLLIDGIKAIADMVGKLGEILWGFITNFVIGDLDSIDLESLKMPDISGVFPFCIPFDVANMLQLFSSEAAAPVFDWPLLLPDGTVTTLNIDLSGLDPVAGVIRTVETVGFVVGLALGTRKILGG